MQTCFNGVRYIDAPSPDNVRRLDYGIVPMVLKMQRNGILIDKDHFAKLSRFLGNEKDRLTEKVRAMTGYYINVGSPDQVEALLFKKLGLKPPPHFKLTKTGKRYVVDDEALSSIKGLHDCIPVIQDYTECHKLKSSYVDVLPVIADPKTGRVHSTFRITRQVGGRISSSDPNLTAQPTRSDLGKQIRLGFIAPPGKKLGTIDQSQIEMRCAAHDAGCVNMIDTFLRGGDIHVETACRIFFQWLIEKLGRMPTKKEAKEAGMDDMKHRYPAKRIGFGVLFGITAQGLLDQILVAQDPSWDEVQRQAYIASWPLERCAEAIQSWYGIYHEIHDTIQRVASWVRRFGYAWDWWGRIRWIPEIRSVHKWIAEAGLRQAFSLRISSSAQGTMKLFMAEVDAMIDRLHLPIDPLLQIHDELLFEGAADYMDECMGKFKERMAQIVRIDVPILCGADTGLSWGALSK